MKRSITAKTASESLKSDLSSTVLLGHRPTWAEIDVGNLVHNFDLMRQVVGPDVAIMPAVKADAYGHGAVVCARVLEKAGADWFGVAMPEEGQQLRAAGIKRPILCLGGFWDGQEKAIIANELTPSLCDLNSLHRLDQEANAAGCIVNYHLKIDTGMGRLGIPHTQLAAFLDEIARFRNLELDGVLTHLAAADLPEKCDFTRLQIDRFARAVELILSRGYNPTWIHQCNSAATHANPRAQGNMVRLGGVIYGLWRDSTNSSYEPLDWKPVMSLRTRVALLKSVPPGTPIGYGSTFVTERRSVIATLPIGYEDGVRRALSNRGRVLIRGRFAPIIGRISMDLTTVDVTDVAEVEVGDEVTVFGRQGVCEITAEEIASEIGTISYEVTCGVSTRVPRIYGDKM